MNFNQNEFYHIYNRGNNGQKIYFEERNYLFFLEKMEKELSTFCSILEYCLMPNHYHILIYTDISRLTTPSGLTTTVKSKWSDKLIYTRSKSSDHSKWSDDCQLQLKKLPRKIGTLQSSYTRAINKTYNKTGSLFQQKANSKNLSDSKIEYLPETCFHYIHQNPFKAGLVEKMQDYKWSSFNEYLQDKTQVCDISLSQQILAINFNDFLNESNKVINNYNLIS